MAWLRVVTARVAALLKWRRLEADLDKELQLHLDMAVQDHVRGGMSVQQARQAARRELGQPVHVRESCRDVWGFTAVDGFLQDLRFGCRSLRLNPGFAATVVITLALGIGVNIAIFSITDAVLFKPLPGIHDPNRLVALYSDDRDTADVEFQGISYPDYLDLRELDDAPADLAAFLRFSFILTNDDAAVEVVGDFVSGTYFSVLGTTPKIGRLLGSADDQPGAPLVTVIGYQLWQDRFGGASAIVGQTITLNDESWTIVGVAPRNFRGSLLDWYGDSSIDVFVPLHTLDRHPLLNRPDRSLLTAREWTGPQVIGRLRPGVSVDAARTALTTRAGQLEATYQATNDGRVLLVRPAQRARFWPGRYADNVRLLALLNAGTVLLLLVACLNLANVSLTRALSRRREMAVRLAIGAGRRRLVRQLLVEVFLLTLCGATVGLGLAWIFVKGLAAYSPPFEVPLYQGFDLDTRALVFAIGLSGITGLAFGLVPALIASRTSLSAALKGNASSRGGTTRVTGRRLLMMGQVAISLVVLVAAGLLGRSLYQLSRVDPGYDPDNLVIVAVGARPTAAAAYGDELGRQFYLSLLDHIRAMPQVESVSVGGTSPLAGIFGTVQLIEPNQAAQPLSVNLLRAGPGYFQALRLPLLRGRDFTVSESDDRDAVVINEALARQMWPGQDPIGQVIRIGSEETERRVIGVARNAAHRDLREAAEPYVYVPFFRGAVSGNATLVMHTRTATPDIVGRLREDIGAFSERLVILDARLMQRDVRVHLSRERLATTVAVALGIITVVLVAVGIFGLFAFIVRQRTREFGIRRALGADRRRLGREVLIGALHLTLLGVAGGVLMWVSLHSIIASEIYGLASNDPLTVSLVAGVLILVSLCAASRPALRVANTHPMDVLRAE